MTLETGDISGRLKVDPKHTLNIGDGRTLKVRESVLAFTAEARDAHSIERSREWYSESIPAVTVF